MERRAAARAPIRCRIEGKMGTQSFLAAGFDISESGVSFITSHELPPNAEVVLHYRLDDDGPMITARVRIVQHSAGRYGAMFVDKKSAASPSKS
jgi:hypothetical protein